MPFETFSEKLQKLVKEKGFIEPTLPQKMGIPAISSGQNVLIIAGTGFGKTEAAMLPFLDKISVENKKPIALLYITPLRSLNRDLLDRLYWWGDKIEVDIAVRHGDTSQAERASQREAPPHCLIVTPETLQAILPGKIMREHLKNVKYVIVDEIHELVESKRGTQLAVALERLKELAGDFQRIGLSATVGAPEIVAEFLGKDVKIIRAETGKKYDIKVESPGISLKDKARAEELFIGAGTFARLRRIYELIASHKSVLAFTNTRETAEVLSSRLRRLDKTLKQDVHHGSLSKERRIRSEQQFKKQELKSLIATSSLELGIDIGSIDLVIQYLSSRQVSKLIQRVGRAGHRVGEVSKGIILSGDEDLFESTIIANMAMKKRLEKPRVHEAPLDVLTNQIIGILMDSYELQEDRIFNIITRAYPYRNLSQPEFSELLKFLETIHLAWLNKEVSSVKRRKKAFTYYFENLSTIPDKIQYRVVSVIENEPIGNLDEEFVAEHGKTGEKFVCSGRAWKVIQVVGNKVMVEPIEDIESAIPAWEGELIPVPYEVAEEVGKLRRKIFQDFSAAAIREQFHVDAKAADSMIELIRKQKASHTVPDDKNILIEDYNDFIIIHCCGGSRLNNTLSRYLGALLTAETGVAVNIKSDPYRIMIQTLAKKDVVRKMLLEPKNAEQVIISALEKSSLFKNRFLHVARRFGVIRKDARYDRININKIVQQYAGTPIYKEALREVIHDKLDIENALALLKRIQEEEIKVHSEKGLSVLGELGLVHQFAEVMKPRMPEKEIFLAFRRRLLDTRVRLVCASCGGYNVMRTVKDVEDQPECPKCHSRLIAVVRKGQTNAAEIVKKKLKKKDMTKEELQAFQTIRRSSDLVIVYGRKAIEAMAGHGVGPQTAARILAMLHPTKEQFYKDILAAEKQFVRTKIYWK
ncbi:MAG: DEAD/DEAH box helicase [Candidatus Aenigmarchaeota archaeon]|nr:DEAD/DEAH box helicase [Candidatus Aenigmarchaeota archaeon]